METAADCFVDAAKAGFMVARNQQLELGDVFEEVLPHEPRRNGVAAGKLLDSAVGPAASLFGRRA